MAYGLNLSKFEDYEVDEFGNPVNKMGMSTMQPNSTVPTEANPFINRGRSATGIYNTGYVPPVINKETALPATTTRRGLDFDFTTKMPELPTAPITPQPPTTTATTSAMPSNSEFVQGVVSPNKKTSFTDWWGKMEPDRKQALTRGLLATGLNMMALGGRTYDRPVSALGVMGEAGKAGLSQYEDTFDREQAHRLRKDYLDIAKEGLKLKSDVYKAKMASMSTADKTLFKDAQSEQAAMIRQFSPMLGDSLAALDPANFLSEINNNPTVREIVEKNIKKTPAGLEKWNRLDGIINQRFGIKLGTGLNLSPESTEPSKKEWELYE